MRTSAAIAAGLFLLALWFLRREPRAPAAAPPAALARPSQWEAAPLAKGPARNEPRRENTGLRIAVGRSAAYE